MKKHGKKLVAPIIISVIIVSYYIAFTLACLLFDGLPLAVKLICGIVPLTLAGVCVFVLIERIKEIRSGEEDDLGKY